MTVDSQFLCTLRYAVLNKEPRNDTDEHKSKEVNGKRLCSADVKVKCFKLFDTAGKREPVNKNCKRRLNNSPKRTDYGAFVSFNKLVFGKEQNLLPEATMFF